MRGCVLRGVLEQTVWPCCVKLLNVATPGTWVCLACSMGESAEAELTSKRRLIYEGILFWSEQLKVFVFFAYSEAI